MSWPIILLLTIIILGTMASACGAVFAMLQAAAFVRAELGKWEQP